MTELQAPFDRYRDHVRPEWIDGNGHMNVGYYLVVFDYATDEFLSWVGLDARHRREHRVTTFCLEAHVSYHREVRSADPLRFTTLLLGHDAKRLHYVHAMYHATGGHLAATNELMSLHVSEATRRGAPVDQARRSPSDGPRPAPRSVRRHRAHRGGDRPPEPCLAPARPVARHGAGPRAPQAEVHPGDALERQRRAPGEHGQARRAPVGRDPRRRGRAPLQAPARRVSHHGGAPRARPRAVPDGGRTQRRPGGGRRAWLPHRLRAPADRARPHADDRPPAVARLGCRRRRLHRPRRAARLLTSGREAGSVAHDRETRNVAEVVRVERPERGAVDERARGDREVDFAPTRPSNDSVELRREGGLLPAEGHDRLVRKQGLLRRQFLGQSWPAAPFVEDEGAQGEALSSLDRFPERAGRTSRSCESVDQEGGVEVDHRARRPCRRPPRRRAARMARSSASTRATGRSGIAGTTVSKSLRRRVRSSSLSLPTRSA